MCNVREAFDERELIRDLAALVLDLLLCLVELLMGGTRLEGDLASNAVRRGFLGPARGRRLTLTAGMLRMCA
jgi:hypothetical protein